MAGRSGSGARGAPIEKPRPLSLLKVTPTRVMERPEREGDVRAGLGATASARVRGWQVGCLRARRTESEMSRVAGWFVVPNKFVGTDERTGRHAPARHERICVCASGGRSAPL
jgi:hypothetical protein